MTPEQFIKAHWQEQNEVVTAFIPQLLEEIDDTIGTQELAERIAAELGWKGEAICKRISGVLMRRIGPNHPEWGTHDGETFFSLGKTMTRWRWHPLKAKPYTGGAPEILTARLFETARKGKALLARVQWPGEDEPREMRWLPDWPISSEDDGSEAILWPLLRAKFAELTGEGEGTEAEPEVDLFS